MGLKTHVGRSNNSNTDKNATALHYLENHPALVAGFFYVRFWPKADIRFH